MSAMFDVGCDLSEGVSAVDVVRRARFWMGCRRPIEPRTRDVGRDLGGRRNGDKECAIAGRS